jgi:hypothetical protein
MTETEHLLEQIGTLATALTNGHLYGDDGEKHALVLEGTGDGHTEPREAWYTCSCGGWSGGGWMQTGHPVEYPPGEDPMDEVLNAWAWLHHVSPRRYSERPSTIMGETHRAMRERQARARQ